jgi:hypothetical protein
MSIRIVLPLVGIGVASLQLFAADASLAPPVNDWLVDPSPFKSQVRLDQGKQELAIGNGLVSRVIRLAPNAATIDYRNLVSGEQLLRATSPEARVTLNGTDYAIGGLEGQPIQNYLKSDWIDGLKSNPSAYQFSTWREEPLKARFEWKKRPEWLARDYPWPAPGRQITLTFRPPVGPAANLGAALLEDRFVGKLDPAWKTRISPKHPRSSFSNEGKAGEIYALPDTSVYAERPWPSQASSVEVTVDAGDDTLSNAWGPGLALIGKNQTECFVIRPNQGCYDLNGQPLDLKFDRSKPCHLRATLINGKAIFEASQDGKPYQPIATRDMPDKPLTLRVGKVGQAGRGDDYPDAKGDGLIRCHVLGVVIREAPPAYGPARHRTDLPEIDVHYAIYDGIPLIEKWLTIRNTTKEPVEINRTVVETLKVQESESAVEPNINWELSNLYVETDYAYLSMNAKSANKAAVRWLPDPKYTTQVNYDLTTPCLLEVAPEFGPETKLSPGESLISTRAFELFRDGSDRERRGLSQRRMYRVIAPWTQENPIMVHLISSDPVAIRNMIDQAAEVGVEMIILSFGSGINLENPDPAYQTKFRELADYARSKNITIGAYSLLASRGAATAADNCGGPGSRVRFGVMPCLGSTWGKNYLSKLQSFFTNTGFGILEHDGSYPGDTCAKTDHPGHRGLQDSQWTQFQAISQLYRWSRANGIYLNVPDWYFLNGSSKCGMNYRETNWSLPRAEQEIIERQNIYDGTWEKTSSMGWMFVPLTQYHGGGAAATIEPLSEHLDHYEARLANLFGAGVQACYRGPRIYDTDATRGLVRKWIGFYKQHREVLDADLIHLRRPDGRDWDGFVHVNPSGKEKALAFFHNPLPNEIVRQIRIPLHYAGLKDSVSASIEGRPPSPLRLDGNQSVVMEIRIPARGRTWVILD